MIESPIVAGLLKISIRLNVLLISLSVYRNPVKAVMALRRLTLLMRSNSNNRRAPRFARSGKRIYVAINIPGWPSRGFNHFIRNELYRNLNLSNGSTKLQTVIFGITNKCNLKCEHCSNALNTTNENGSSPEKLNQVVKTLKKTGLQHIQYTGGEPLEVFDYLLELVRVAGKMDSWVLTSGFGLTEQKAKALKNSGLTGVNISLDHWDKSKHNKFRGNKESYLWVQKAVVNSKKAGLLVSLSLCLTRDFTSGENLNKYIKQAEEWGVQFIRLLEPKRSGGYATGNIRLQKEQLNLLDTFFFAYNSNITNRKQPILMYPDLRNREKCIGKGDRYIYIDMDGNVHPCPFSLNGSGNILEEPLDEILKNLIKAECINCNQID